MNQNVATFFPKKSSHYFCKLFMCSSCSCFFLVFFRDVKCLVYLVRWDEVRSLYPKSCTFYHTFRIFWYIKKCRMYRKVLFIPIFSDFCSYLLNCIWFDVAKKKTSPSPRNKHHRNSPPGVSGRATLGPLGATTEQPLLLQTKSMKKAL